MRALLLMLLSCCSPLCSLCVTDAFSPSSSRAFLPRPSSSSSSSTTTAAQSTASAAAAASSASVISIPTQPIAGMKPGTSGLRKRVEVWQGVENPEMNQYYLNNFIQALIETAAEDETPKGKMPETILVAGDGRYFNDEAMIIICRMLAANGVSNILLPRGGIMSTPAVSAAIRASPDIAGGIVLTASHNPGGPGNDFGIKYNLRLGQPAGEDFTDRIYEKTLQISSFQTLSEEDDGAAVNIDLNANVGTNYALTSTSTVTIIDPYEDYIRVLKECFDFQALQQFFEKHSDAFQLLFDGMHGAGGPFARRVFIEELGLPESSLLRCDPKPDFGKGHPDPNLTYAATLIKRMGLLPDGSADPTAAASAPTLGAANDGDGDRNLIAGAGCFVTPSDSLAMICDNWRAIPHFAKRGGPKGVARSMPSSAALDVVAEQLNIPCFVTPTGWKFFGNLMSSKELFDKQDFTPFLCGEESFGTGSCHIREKDGLWAALAWMSILMKVNEEGNTAGGDRLISIREIVEKHWAKYGRHFYCRYDYEEVDSDAANKVMDLIRNEFVGKDSSALPSDDGSGIQLVGGEEFSYTDPVDGSTSSNQGLILRFQCPPTGDPARVVFRLSGTGSAGATVRVYLEKFEQDVGKHGQSAPVALKALADRAIALVKMQELTGRDAPTVIT